MNIFGVIPARMASSRFPGKPLAAIRGYPMVEHVFRRAQLFDGFQSLYIATCDKEIADFSKRQSFPCLLTSPHHTRCLDRVAEAVLKAPVSLSQEDIVVCVQGDEPMLHHHMIEAVVAPLLDDKDLRCTVLAMEIADEEQFRNPDTVKIIHDLKGDVLYTSRSPIPYCSTLTKETGALRIYGIFAFRWEFLQIFTQLAPSPLEIKESCDSNRIMDYGLRQRAVFYPYCPSFSVDSPADLIRVEAHLDQDPLYASLFGENREKIRR